MSLQKTFSRGSQASLFEVLAATGLALNALVVSSQAPISGQYVHGASLFIFGFGAIGLATMFALPHAEKQSIVAPNMVILGGIILGVTASAILGALTAVGSFNNLLAVLVLASFAGFYVFLWMRMTTWSVGDLAFH